MQSSRDFELPSAQVPAEREQGQLCFPVSALMNKCTFIVCSAAFSAFWGILLVISLLKMALTPCAEVLSGVRKCKKAVTFPYGVNICIREASFKCELQCCWPRVQC